jgi:ribosomal protein L34
MILEKTQNGSLVYRSAASTFRKRESTRQGRKVGLLSSEGS